MWAGGKNKMIPKYLEHPGIPTSGYDTYVEPFFGGGAMMIWIYENSPTVKHFVLNDINTEIVGIYQAIKSDVAQFTARMDQLQTQYIPLSKENRRKFYYDLRAEYATSWAQWSATEESATLYFLMKTAFNGIWQTTKEANGRFCTPCGLLNQKTTVYDRDNVMEWHNFLQQVTICSGPWQQAVDVTEGRAFYFFDPPYRDSFTQYGTTFDDAAHVELIDFCKQTDLAGNLVMYCNRKAGPTDTFYTVNQGQLLLNEYDIKYTAGRRATETVEEDGVSVDKRTAKAAKEILLYSPSIQPSLPANFEYAE